VNRSQSEDSLLLLEYERSSEFCNHVDDVRNVITSFFLTAVGAAVFVLDKYGSGDLKSGPLGRAALRAGLLLYVVSFTGLLFVLVIARLRRVQLERYVMMNGILDLVLTQTRTVVPFTDAGISGRSAQAIHKRLTGSFLWTVIIVLPSSILTGIATALILGLAGVISPLDSVIGGGVGVLFFATCDRLYFLLSE